ncbi:MAG: NnrU family protein [Hyphomonas sp.]|uniref:NnrU family protein n=1 Tax=Hyphomonas sp. TaxID=87 RepID=UPI001832984F|nr:NnrU family protein [Hyphomonas sp.]MBU3922398.1 NnrU family protein [Alphaproteobacteria bacterium]MBA3066969.1 NnrU family protein [Hyphomonas sp.]MBU4060527.1 NnrU family protein [Alphaproteobacteria bacterium]MBU4165795.1 NnrU family protein [Alphaproteobacteria bacterium]MBU4567526.1 NnrU family protein [Alphaproteobacteria bacterium]
MTYLILGLVIFFGSHLFSAFRSREAGKDLREKIGYGPYMGLYSLVSAVGLGLIVWGFGAARPSQVLYAPPAGLAHVNLLLMVVALILLAAAYMPTGYIKKAVKHPMLAAVKVWAFGHLLANGELNSVLLFGCFLAYGVIDRIAVKKRGDNGPGPDAAVNVTGDIGAVVVGLGAYAAVAFYLHPVLFGVAAMPG